MSGARGRQIDIERSTVSRTILLLMDKGLVECLTPDERMGRYYRITETGRQVLDVIEGGSERGLSGRTARYGTMTVSQERYRALPPLMPAGTR